MRPGVELPEYQQKLQMPIDADRIDATLSAAPKKNGAYSSQSFFIFEEILGGEKEQVTALYSYSNFLPFAGP